MTDVQFLSDIWSAASPPTIALVSTAVLLFVLFSMLVGVKGVMLGLRLKRAVSRLEGLKSRSEVDPVPPELIEEVFSGGDALSRWWAEHRKGNCCSAHPSSAPFLGADVLDRDLHLGVARRILEVVAVAAVLVTFWGLVSGLQHPGPGIVMTGLPVADLPAYGPAEVALAISSVLGLGVVAWALVQRCRLRLRRLGDLLDGIEVPTEQEPAAASQERAVRQGLASELTKLVAELAEDPPIKTQEDGAAVIAASSASDLGEIARETLQSMQEIRTELKLSCAEFAKAIADMKDFVRRPHDQSGDAEITPFKGRDQLRTA